MGVTILHETRNIRINVGEGRVKKTEFLITWNQNLAFKITTKPFGWEVQREEEEFYKMRGLLTQTFPQLIVPPLPPNWENKFTKKSIAKR